MSPVREEWFGDRFVQVHPDLVKALSGDAVGALVLAAVRYRLRRYGTQRDGRMWWRGTQAEIEEITGLSREQVRRAVERLRGAWLDTEKEHSGGVTDHTFSYALVYEVASTPDRVAPTPDRSGVGAQSRSGVGAQSSTHQEVEEELPPPTPSRQTEQTVTEEDDGFEAFWQAYPRKERRVVAEAAYQHALRSTTAETILHGAQGYARRISRDDTEPRFIQTPDRWLREERWTDDYRAPRHQIPWWGTADD